MTSMDVKKLRQEHGLSQDQFAELINKTRSYVSKVERGFHHVTPKMENEINAKIEQLKNGNYSISRKIEGEIEQTGDSDCPTCGLPKVRAIEHRIPRTITTIEETTMRNSQMLSDIMQTLQIVKMHDEIVQRKVQEILETKIQQIVDICTAHARVITKVIDTIIKIMETSNPKKENIIKLLANISDQLQDMIDIIPRK